MELLKMFSFAVIGFSIYFAHLRGGVEQVGTKHNITCPDGHLVECHRGTLDCYDNNPNYCKNTTLILGSESTIICPNGKEVHCQRGTENCYNGSQVYCPVGEPQTINCYNNISHVIYTRKCPSGSQDCYENSPKYC